MKIKIKQLAVVNGRQLALGDVADVEPVIGMALVTDGIAEIIQYDIEMSEPAGVVEKAAIKPRRKQG